MRSDKVVFTARVGAGGGTGPESVDDKKPCCGGARKLPVDRTFRTAANTPRGSQRAWQYMIVGNFTGYFVTTTGRDVGHVQPGSTVKIYANETDDSRLIPLSQKSLKAVRSMIG